MLKKKGKIKSSLKKWSSFKNVCFMYVLLYFLLVVIMFVLFFVYVKLEIFDLDLFLVSDKIIYVLVIVED